MGSLQAGYCSIGHGSDIVKYWAMEDMFRGSRLVASGDSKKLLYFLSSMSLQYIDHVLQLQRCLGTLASPNVCKTFLKKFFFLLGMLK